jgi:hypothetical protein
MYTNTREDTDWRTAQRLMICHGRGNQFPQVSSVICSVFCHIVPSRRSRKPTNKKHVALSTTIAHAFWFFTGCNSAFFCSNLSRTRFHVQMLYITYKDSRTWNEQPSSFICARNDLCILISISNDKLTDYIQVLLLPMLAYSVYTCTRFLNVEDIIGKIGSVPSIPANIFI